MPGQGATPGPPSSPSVADMPLRCRARNTSAPQCPPPFLGGGMGTSVGREHPIPSLSLPWGRRDPHPRTPRQDLFRELPRQRRPGHGRRRTGRVRDRRHGVRHGHARGKGRGHTAGGYRPESGLRRCRRRDPRILTRHSGHDPALLIAQVKACLIACQHSHDLCSGHAQHHDHCRICAEATARATEACRSVLKAVRG